MVKVSKKPSNQSIDVSFQFTPPPIPPLSEPVYQPKMSIFLDTSPVVITKQHVLQALRNVIHLPTLLIQLGGYFPYILTPENELQPFLPLVAVVTFQLFVHFLGALFFFTFSKEFTDIYGNFTVVEIYTAKAFCVLGLFIQVGIRVALYLNNSDCVNYHSSMNKLFCRLILSGNGSDSRNEAVQHSKNKLLLLSITPKLYLQWINDASSRIKRACIVVCGAVVASMLFFLFPLLLTPAFMKIHIVTAILFGLVTLGCTLSMVLFNGTVLWLVSYVNLKIVAFKIIQHKATVKEERDFYSSSSGHRQEGFAGLQSLTEHVTLLENLLDKFNGFSATYFVSWFIFVVSMTVSQLYQVLLWARYEFYSVIMLSAPMLVTGTVTMHFICSLSSELTSQGKHSVEALCNCAAEEYYDDAGHGPEEHEGKRGNILFKKVTLLYSKWQTAPSSVSPGGYFVLNKRLLTSISGIMTTFILVLLQFTDEGKPEYVDKWKQLAKKAVSTSATNFNTATTMFSVDAMNSTDFNTT